MALPATRHIFGINNVTLYNYASGLPYGTMKALGGSNFELSGEMIKLEAGAYPFAWGVEDGYMSGALTIKPKQYEEFMIEVFLGKAPTATTDDSGSVTTLTNKKGTSVMADTGIGSLSITTGSEAELKYGRYVVEAQSATTFKVFCLTDGDFSRGTDVSFEDETLEITASAETCAASATVALASYGLDFNCGSGTIALTSGDTATFTVKPPSSKSYTVTIGGVNDRTPTFGAYLLAEPRGNGEMTSIDVFKCRGIGLPFNLEAKAWSEAEIKAEAMYDDDESGVCEIRSILPTTPF